MPIRHAVLFFLVLLAGCGGGSDSSNPVAPSPDPPVADTTAPSVPQGVLATPQSDTTIQLSWEASTDSGSGVGGYHVFRKGESNPLATVTATQYTDTGLA